MNARALTAFACAIAALASLGSVPAAAGERLDNIVNPNFERDFQKASFNCPND